MKVAFITVHYNTPTEVFDYINSIQNLDRDGVDIRIEIVDSGSSVDNLQCIEGFLRSFYDPTIKIELQKLNQNVGYLKGLNIGIKSLNDLKYKPDFWILGNNDVLFENDFLSELKKVNYDKDTLILAPNIKNASGVFENPHELKPIPQKRLRFYDLYYTNYYVGMSVMKLYGFVNRIFTNRRRSLMKSEKKEFMFIHFCTGCKFILTKNFFHYYQQLREDVFLWAEEVLISYQVWSINKKMLYCPTLKMYHKLSVATGRLPSRKKYNQMRDAHWKVRKFHKKEQE